MLRVFFYLMRVMHLDKHDSANLAIREVISFWEKGRIPISAHSWCVEKLLKVYKNWQTIKKTITRRNAHQESLEKAFTESLDDLFDIAKSNALETMKEQEDKEYLVNQRRKGRPSSMM